MLGRWRRPDLQDREWDKVLQQSVTKGNQAWRLKYCKPHQTMPWAGQGQGPFSSGQVELKPLAVTRPLVSLTLFSGAGEVLGADRLSLSADPFSPSARGLHRSSRIQSVVCYWTRFAEHLKVGPRQNEHSFRSILSYMTTHAEMPITSPCDIALYSTSSPLPFLTVQLLPLDVCL